jgi:Cu-Zn family superoxide dismutase
MGKMTMRCLASANYLSFAAGIILTMLSSCACNDPRKPEVDKEKPKNGSEVAQLDTKKWGSKLDLDVTAAVAVINPVGSNKIQGKVSFNKVDDGIRVVADIDGLTPGEHGFHVHEFGDCSGKDAAGVGAHFNPTNSKHGGPDSAERHVGDLGNLVADEKGHAHYERVDKLIKLQGKNSILGRSIIIHADKDDYVTQPSGASGAKIGCGIIEPVTN